MIVVHAAGASIFVMTLLELQLLISHYCSFDLRDCLVADSMAPTGSS